MLSAIQQLRENIERVRVIGGLYEALSRLTTPAVDASDLLRTQIVMAVSSLDHYIHEIARIGMLEVYGGQRPLTPAFQRFQVKMENVRLGLHDPRMNAWFETEIREIHGYIAFQRPDKIADAVRLFSSCELWPSVASQLGLTAQDVKTRLQLIVERRNKIAHEADLDPSYPGSRWPISRSDATDTVNFIEDVCEAIHSAII